jgi:glycosyltransferase involved in cell wall biosynthesis
MKILHVVTGLAIGGAERALYNLLAGGLTKRFDTAVVSLRDEGTMGPLITALGVSVYAMKMCSCVSGATAIGGLHRIVRSFRPDLIQGWMYHGNLAASGVAWMGSKRPVVVWNIRHCFYDLKAEKPLTRQVIRGNRFFSGHADTVIYNSRLAKTQHEAFGFASDQSLILPNGFDVARLRPEPEIGLSVRKELDIPEDAVVVGHVARFHPMKDHISFLQAAVQVARRIPVSRFLLVGRDVSLENPALINIVPLEFRDRFFFTGERSDVHRLMQAMDVLCSSSWSEAFPNVLGEAMACGVPCVATSVGDCSDIIGDTGIVVPPSDSEILAQGLLAMLEKDGAERRALGRAARERVKIRYSLRTVVGEYISLYERLHPKGKR